MAVNMRDGYSVSRLVRVDLHGERLVKDDDVGDVVVARRRRRADAGLARGSALEHAVPR